LQATGTAEATRLQGQAQADVIRLQGSAEAEIIAAKGKAEANAMQIRAEAFQEYNQAAILDKLLSGLPEVVRALAEPLTKVDKITVVSTGDGNGQGVGVNKITADIATMIAQVPAMFEALTGIKVADLMKQVPQIGAGQESVTKIGTNGAQSTDGQGAPSYKETPGD
jgi:flotillin